MLNSTPLIILIMFLSILSLVIALLVASLVLRLFSRLFKFQKNDFKTAFYCSLIILGILIGVNSILSILFLDQIQKLSSILTILSSVASFIAGGYVIHRFYRASIFKSFLALALTGLIVFIAWIFIAILISLILSPYLKI